MLRKAPMKDMTAAKKGTVRATARVAARMEVRSAREAAVKAQVPGGWGSSSSSCGGAAR